MFKIPKTVLVVAPHPDDETLGVGGTLKKFTSLGCEVKVVIVSGHKPPLYPKNDYDITLNESKKVFKLLNIKSFEDLDFIATKLNEIPNTEINNKIDKILKKFKPDLFFIPFPDRHIDHRVVFDSCIVASRPKTNYYPKTILAYETLSETHWNIANIEPSFNPDFFINIDKEIKFKIKALKIYKSQINNKNKSRSPDAAESLARFRGSQNGCKHAEAFKVIRIIF